MNIFLLHWNLILYVMCMLASGAPGSTGRPAGSRACGQAGTEPVMPMALHCLVLDSTVDVPGRMYNAQSVASRHVALASMLSAEIDPH